VFSSASSAVQMNGDKPSAVTLASCLARRGVC
jgi:hypothetical protein